MFFFTIPPHIDMIGRVAMLATVGFLVGEAVESKTVLFNGEITGPAIDQLLQVNPILYCLLGALIAKAEVTRAEAGWVEPAKVRYDRPGQLRDEYVPGKLQLYCNSHKGVYDHFQKNAHILCSFF